jgi:inorganic pyrophosphatase
LIGDDLRTLPCRASRGTYRVVVETPRGALFKVRYEPSLRAFELQRLLPVGHRYPFDWGFFPGTKAEDGDPLDAMVLFEGSTWPGLVVTTTPVAVLRVVEREPAGQGKGKGSGTKARRKVVVRNDRVLVVPAIEGLSGGGGRAIPPRLREQLETFFLAAGAKPDKEIRIEGWEGPKAARACIERAAAAWSASLV